MSLAINTTTPEGIVLAADSRQSYRNQKGMARIGSDSASKLFQINSRIGVAITGLAFLPEDNVLKNVSKFIEQFRRETEVEKMSVKEVADKLHYIFNKKYNWQNRLDQLPDQIKADLVRQGHEVIEIKKEKHHVVFKFKDQTGQIKQGRGNIDPIILFVAGYNIDGSHEVYNCYIPGEIMTRRDSKKQGMEYGANWIGQNDVVSRTVLGWDGRIFGLPFMQEVLQKYGQPAIEQQIRGLEYAINWGTMTLQDAIDFCVLSIKTTSAMQRFSDGTLSDPGDMPGVGGLVDVAVITPDNGFKWVNKKKLVAEGNEVEIEL